MTSPAPAACGTAPRGYAGPVAARVLVVDDDATVRDVVARYLGEAGYQVDLAGDGDGALRACRGPAGRRRARPDAARPSGLDVCRALRAGPAPPAIVMLTALGEEDDRIRGLELGADDYVTKPFSARELVLRIGSVLRRATPAAADTGPLVDGDLRGRPRRAARHPRGAALALTTREFDLLAFLLAHPGRAFTRADLLARVWGWEFGDQSTVTVHVRRLREKIEADPTQPRRIATIWGTGYRYDAGAAGDGNG